MAKYATNIKGTITGLVQGKGAKITMNGQEITGRYTTESCPQCRGSAQCEHGVRDEHNRPIHTWTCRFCGELQAIIGYACSNCN